MRVQMLLGALSLLLAGCSQGSEQSEQGTDTTKRGAQAPESQSEGWPYPGDIPEVQAADPGLAGEEPTDIVRFLMVRRAFSPALSPDGGKLAFRTTITGKPQLWVTDSGGGWPHQITFGQSVTFHAWAPDGAGIIYGADREGNEREAFWFISADGTRERQLLDFSDAFRSFGAFSPDGSRIVYSSTARNGLDFDIYVADVGNGEVRMVREGRYGNYVQSWQPGGDLVVVSETRGEDANDVHLLNIETGEQRTIFQPDVAARYSGFAWTPDGGGFYLATNQGREFTALAHYDLESGDLEILDAPEHNVGNVVLSPDGRYLGWTTNEGGYSILHVRDLESGEMLEAPDLPDGVMGLTMASRAPVLAINLSGPRVPGDIWTWNLENGELHRATKSTMAGIDPDSLVVPSSEFFEARDGVRLHGLLYMPRSDRVAGDNPPVVVDVHGGPTAQARPSFQAVTQYLTGKGIAVFDVNVRGSTGFGKSYARLDNQRKRTDSVRDLVDALAWLDEDGRVDASRAAVMGGSYGGYMVNAVVGSYPDAFDAGVSFVGVSDWVRALEGAFPALKASDRIEYGDISDPEVREFHRRISPINKANEIKAPLLVSHGANDPRDPVSESDRLVQAVRDNGVPVTYLRFPDEGHGVRKLENRVTLYREVADFLEAHLQNAGN